MVRLNPAVLALALSLSLAAAAPAGAGCPLRLDEHTIGLPSTCLFIGAATPDSTCRGPITAVFAGDGDTLVIALGVEGSRSLVFVPARTRSANTGDLVFWEPDADLATAPVTGSVQLENDGGTLRVRVAGAPLQAAGCSLSEFVGRFEDMVDAPSDAVAMQR